MSTPGISSLKTPRGSGTNWRPFGGPNSVDGFMLDVPKNIAFADKYWAQEVSGSNAFVQRVRRLVDRVPHYRTGAELAEDIARAKGK